MLIDHLYYQVRSKLALICKAGNDDYKDLEIIDKEM